MAKGKSINLFLIDGMVDGRVKCTIANWTGLCYKVPRTMLEACQDIPALKQSGVYFLFGRDDITGKESVYVGQAGIRKNGEGLLHRWMEHDRNPEKDYWTEAIALTTSNNTFGPTEISYLEHRFCSIALEAKRYEVRNGNEPSPGNVTEEKKCELEEYIEYALVVIGTLGHRVFLPIVGGNPGDVAKPAILYCKTHYASAQGYVSNDGFVVLKGSRIRSNTTPSCPEYILKMREHKKAEIDNEWTLKEDILFNSPSTAASFVCGASENGFDMWKNANGVKLKELH